MFLFFMKKNFLKIASLILLLAVTMFVSCEQPPGKITDDDNEETLYYPPGEIAIYSPADMAKIGIDKDYPLTGTYVLMNDIELENWTPIGGAQPFYGVFDGNGKTITLKSFSGPVGSIAIQANAAGTAFNTYINVFWGIFAHVKGTSSRKAAIKNLAIVSSVDAVSNGTAGAACGLAAAYAELAEIDSITLSGTFDFYSESGKTAYVGGVAGIISKTMVKNCNTSMTMNIKPGYGAPLVYGLPNPFSYVGSIAGIFLKESEIHNCHNSGDVSGISSVNGSQVIVGGIAGGSFYAYTTEYSGCVKDSSSSGDIITGCLGFWPMAGGIAGTVCGGNGTRENSTRIEHCYATGTVSVKESPNASTWPYIGGIAGYVYYGGWVSQCYFNGKVIVNRRNDYAGGIAGYSSNATTKNYPCVIEDCWSDGEVTGFNNAGGIVGQNQQNTLLKRCYSLMEISVTNNANGPNTTAQWGVGGIAGSHSSTIHEDAIEACVALNPTIYAPLGDEIHRITGRMQAAGGVMPKMTNNYALPDLLPLTDDPNKQFEWKKGLIDAQDGEDIPASYISDGKPTQAFYESIGWDFTTVWKMAANGYPQLQWQGQ